MTRNELLEKWAKKWEQRSRHDCGCSPICLCNSKVDLEIFKECSLDEAAEMHDMWIKLKKEEEATSPFTSDMPVPTNPEPANLIMERLCDRMEELTGEPYTFPQDTRDMRPPLGIVDPFAPTQESGNGIRDSVPADPKGEAGKLKCPLHLIPATAMEEVAYVHQLGSKKYGEYNWRATGVSANTYIAAIMRHLNAYRSGEDLDPESGRSHIAHVGANVNILLDAAACDTLVDDRYKKPN